jgi:hypothetical protein
LQVVQAVVVLAVRHQVVVAVVLVVCALLLQALVVAVHLNLLFQ